MKKAASQPGQTPSDRITNQIAQLNDWRGKILSRLRKLILEADPHIAEEWKWNAPVWAREGLVCSSCAFKDHVKLNFFSGAAVKDPKRLFNAGLDAKKSRAIDFNERSIIDAPALKELVRAAITHNSNAGETATKKK
jgi:hypothetical protein